VSAITLAQALEAVPADNSEGNYELIPNTMEAIIVLKALILETYDSR
jgi:hypothetical protein